MIANMEAVEEFLYDTSEKKLEACSIEFNNETITDGSETKM